jgi:hypothetical protein
VEFLTKGLHCNSNPNGKETKSIQGRASVHHHSGCHAAQGRHKVGELHDAGAEAASWPLSLSVTRAAAVRKRMSQTPSKCPKQSDPPPDPLLMNAQCFYLIFVYQNLTALYHYFNFIISKSWCLLITWVIFFNLSMIIGVAGEIWIIVVTSCHEINIISSSWLLDRRWDLGNNHAWNRDQLQLKTSSLLLKRRWSHQSNPLPKLTKKMQR